jgi:hypothetical protein
VRSASWKSGYGHPFNRRVFNQSAKNLRNIQKYVYTRVRTRQGNYLGVSFEIIGSVVKVDSKMRFLLVEDAPVQSQNHIDQTTPLTNLANLQLNPACS